MKPAPGTRRAFGVAADLNLEAHVTGTTRSSDGLDSRRRRLLFRSWHRGIREADLIMGRFADAHIADLTDAQLDEYERLLDAQEHDLVAWITGQAALPPDVDTDLFRRLRNFHFNTTE